MTPRDPVIDPAKVGLAALDAVRRRTGRALAAAGLGPRTTPSTVVEVTSGVRLHAYPGAVVSAAASPREFTAEPRIDLLRSCADPATLGTHLRVLR